jgi:ABC-type sugar transport system ATPase subunit
MEESLIEIKNLTKAFSKVIVLDNISLSIKKGIVHGIIGENGAGKSTLIKILAGIYNEYDGEIYMNNVFFKPSSPLDAYRKGISTIFQELNIIPKQTVLENIFLGREILISNILLDRRAMLKKSLETIKSLAADIRPNDLAGDLSVANQQIVEICKAIVFNVNLLIMDEPTSSLTSNETEGLFELIRKLKNDGKTILYISHRLNEVFDICDVITVLRDGKLVGTVKKEESNTEEIVKMMVGRDLKSFYPERKKPESSKTVLSVKKLSRKNEFKHISFNLKEGEILGFGGLIGAGRTELAKAIIGISRPETGEITIIGENINYYKNPRQALDQGLAFLPENRKDEGIFQLYPVRENICISIMDRISKFSFIQFKSMKTLAEKNVERFKIKVRSINQVMETLSGGNQQKTIISRLLSTESKIFIFDEPTRGIDVGSKYDIYNFMNEITYRGGSIVFISSELPELLNMADRIMLMRGGEIVKELEKKNGGFTSKKEGIDIEEEIMQILTLGEEASK